ncbi:hypothetical protein PAHAL_9G557800 [Panicum hallii]|jgi:hypothetical protein|uniref:Calmodulin-binding domain-containing protein n=1 Tax=Panicum hallii TaxID=206008 RepID=A0A2S3ITE7_9POAL|nr:uncharacterized protein LOC112875264 [Panicum hallii]PAN50932.1 hypothetical protein PAHAL_9G557800 [Panicum hallii]
MSKALEKSSPDSTTPTSSASPPESKKHEKTMPNYLRASRGSCHDFCKYGHKNPSEEEPNLSGGGRKKLPAHLKNLSLHRSAILDRSKDVRNMSLSLAKSSISLGVAVRVAPRTASANRKGVASNEHMVPLTATAAENKTLNSDERKKYSTVAQKVPTNLRYSNGVKQIDKRDTVPAKGAIFPAKSKFPEKASLEKYITVGKVTTVNQSRHKRPASSPSKLNMIKQVPSPSQASSHYLLSKDKSTPKGKVASPAATITRVRSKPGQSATRSSDAIIKGKQAINMSGSSSSVEPKLIASVEKQKDDMQIRSYSIESTVAELSTDATENGDNSQPAPEETSKSISKDDGVRSTEKSESIAGEGEALLESAIALELQQSLDGQEFNAMIGESDLEHKLAEQNIIHGQASKDEDSQADDAALCQLSEHITVVENADVYDSVLIESNSKIEDDQVEVNAPVESLISEGKDQVAVSEDFGTSPELLVVDEKHAEEPDSCLDFASGNAVENAKADEIFDARMNNNTSHCQSISETSSDGVLMEEPKSMLIEPSDSAVDELANVSNENTFERDRLKSEVFISQSPEELSNDEFFEEYYFESSESDESGTEDEEATINRDRGESLKSGDPRRRRISTVELDDASLTPYKMKFKRGKIVELPPDSSGPRRLKFRRKSASEVSNRETQPTRRIYKRNSTSNVVPTNQDMESPGVKLRHQDAQEKKDAQGLFNNVIEETASKLVESRKSKVKALVGAFETVISLQDGKPTSSTQQAGSSEDLFPDDEGNAPEEAE